jgi:lipoprotein-anchoring transpeptidase ErfK/SrfK
MRAEQGRFPEGEFDKRTFAIPFKAIQMTSIPIHDFSRHVFNGSWMRRMLLVVGALSLAACTTLPELGALVDKGGTKGRRIVVSLKSQQAALYHQGELVGVSPISSGREGKSTPVGRYSVIEKDADHRSTLYGNYVRDGKVVKENVDIRKGGRPAGSRFEGVPMPYFMRFTGAYGLHAGNIPGYPASSGCVRLPKRQAKRFYDAVRLGTPVVVQR